MAQQRLRWWAGALAGVVLAAGCGSGGDDAADKAGGDTVVLHLATIDSDINGNGQLFGPTTFVEALERVSDGQIKVDVTTAYEEGAPDAESQLVEAIASGDLDGGWPSTRSFAQAGIDGLQPVETPMAITSYAAEAAVANGPVAEELLDQLEGSGVTGLGLAVGPLRRPFAAEAPLLAPADWSGAAFRSYNSPVQADAISALGGEPKNIGTDWPNAVAAGELRGAEFDLAQYQSNGLAAEIPFVTSDVVLWPKMFVLSLNEERYESLTDEQRGFVEAAAREAVEASVAGPYDDSGIATELCDVGVRFFDAGSDELDALHEALAPVVQELADDPATGPIVEAIQAIAEEHPDAEPIEVPEGCGTEVPDQGSAVPDEASDLPDGLYRVEITADEVADYGVSNGSGWSGTWSLTVHDDGTYEMHCATLDLPGKDCGQIDSDGTHVLDAGYLRGGDGPVYFVGDGEVMSELGGCELPPSPEPGHCFVLDPYWFEWSLDGDQLTFSDAGGFDVPNMVIEPWTRIS